VIPLAAPTHQATEQVATDAAHAALAALNPGGPWSALTATHPTSTSARTTGSATSSWADESTRAWPTRTTVPPPGDEAPWKMCRALVRTPPGSPRAAGPLPWQCCDRPATHLVAFARPHPLAGQQRG
jgi:hypothetical protein